MVQSALVQRQECLHALPVRQPTQFKSLNAIPKQRMSQKLQRFRNQAASVDAPSTSNSKDTDFQQAIGILRQATETRKAPANLVAEAMIKLEKLRLADDSYAEILGGGDAGRRWELVFVSGAGDVKKANKGQGYSGKYNPIPTAQWWKKDTGSIENGIFLGPIGALVFCGPYDYKKNKLTFDFNKLKIRLGPKWLEFNLGTKEKQSKDLPFFILAYADEQFIVAKGRGGGIALWQRASPEWEFQNGVGVL